MAVEECWVSLTPDNVICLAVTFHRVEGGRKGCQQVANNSACGWWRSCLKFQFTHSVDALHATCLSRSMQTAINSARNCFDPQRPTAQQRSSERLWPRTFAFLFAHFADSSISRLMIYDKWQTKRVTREQRVDSRLESG